MGCKILAETRYKKSQAVSNDIFSEHGNGDGSNIKTLPIKVRMVLWFAQERILANDIFVI